MAVKTRRPRCTKTVLPAKLSAPKLSAVYPRARLFAALDKASEHPVVWVEGPAGAGKTTLIASWLHSRKRHCLWYQMDAGDDDVAAFFYYLGQAAAQAAPRFRKALPLLTPEYLLGIPVFTRRYFEELFRRLKAPAVIVFDNYQDVAPESGFHGMIAHALEVIPAGINVVILSRGDPPPALSRLRANNGMGRLEWSDVRFTPEESRGLLERRGWRDGSDEKFKTLHRKTEGWAAGLVLLAAGEERTGTDAPAFDISGAREVFDYFASQIFDRTDAPTQRFLLTAAFLPSMTVSMAKELTGSGDTAGILERLARQHYFTQKTAQVEPAFRFHALFREFLLAKARALFTAKEQRDIQSKAASQLCAAGRIEDAVAALAEIGDWPALTGLVLAEARSLAVQGRIHTLENWIHAIPVEIRESNGWLQFWAGMGAIATDPRKAHRHFDLAFRLFDTHGDVAGSLIVWSEAVFAVLVAWDDLAPLDSWMDWFYRRPEPFSFPDREIEAHCAAAMAGAMTWRRTHHPDAPFWMERALETARQVGGPELGVRSHTYALLYCLRAAISGRRFWLPTNSSACHRHRK